jgi:DNA-binding response OmpR family regulator
MSNLRKKLGLSANGEERIRNVRGSGYAYLGELGAMYSADAEDIA